MLISLRATSRGMGATGTGIARCAAFVADGSYWYHPGCWGYSKDAWTQMAQFPTPPAPTSPAGPSTIAQETLPGAFTPDQAIAAGVDYSGFFQTVPYVPGAPEAVSSGSNQWLYLALGIGLVALLLLMRGR